MKKISIIQTRELYYWINQQVRVSRPLYEWSNANIKSLIHYITTGEVEDAKHLYMLFVDGEDQYWFNHAFKPNVALDKQLFILDFIQSYIDKVSDIEIAVLETLFEIRFIYPFCTHPVFAMLTEERFKQSFLNEEYYESLDEELRKAVCQEYLVYFDSSSIHISRGWDALFGFGDIALHNQLEHIKKNLSKSSQDQMLSQFRDYVNASDLSRLVPLEDRTTFRGYANSMTLPPFKHHLLLCLKWLPSPDYSGILDTIADGFNAYDDERTSCAEGMKERFIDFAKTLMSEEQYLNECGKLRLLEQSLLSADMLRNVKAQCVSIIQKNTLFDRDSWDDENAHDIELAEQHAIAVLQKHTQNNAIGYLYSYILTRSFEDSWCSFVKETVIQDEIKTLKQLSNDFLDPINTLLQESHALSFQNNSNKSMSINSFASSVVQQVTEEMNPIMVRMLGDKRSYLDDDKLSKNSTQFYVLSDEAIQCMDRSLWVQKMNDASLSTIKKMVDDYILSRNDHKGILIKKLAENIKSYNDTTKVQVIAVLHNHMTKPVLKDIKEYKVHERLLITVDPKKRKVNIEKGDRLLKSRQMMISSPSIISKNHKLLRQYLAYDGLDELFAICSESSGMTSDALVISRMVNSDEQNIMHLAITQRSNEEGLRIMNDMMSLFLNNDQRKRIDWLLESSDEDGLSVTHEAAIRNRADVLELYTKHLPKQYMISLILQNNAINNQSTLLLALKYNSLAFIHKMMSLDFFKKNKECIKSMFNQDDVINELVQSRSVDKIQFVKAVLNTIDCDLLAEMIINEPYRWLGAAIQKENWEIFNLFLSRMMPNSKRLFTMFAQFDQECRSIAYYMSSNDLLQFIRYDAQRQEHNIYAYNIILFLGLYHCHRYEKPLVSAINMQSTEFFSDCLTETLEQSNTDFFSILYQTKFAKDYLGFILDTIKCENLKVLKTYIDVIIKNTSNESLVSLLMSLTSIDARVFKFFAYHFIQKNDLKTALLLAKKHHRRVWLRLIDNELMHWLVIKSNSLSDDVRKRTLERCKHAIAQGFYDSNDPELIIAFYRNTQRFSQLDLRSRVVKMCIDHTNVDLLGQLIEKDCDTVSHLIGQFGVAHYAAMKANTDILQLLFDKQCTDALKLKIRGYWFWEYGDEMTQNWIQSNRSYQQLINIVQLNESSKRRLDDIPASSSAAKRPRF